MSTEKKQNSDNKQKTRSELIRKKEEQIAAALKENLLRRKLWIKKKTQMEREKIDPLHQEGKVGNKQESTEKTSKGEQ